MFRISNFTNSPPFDDNSVSFWPTMQTTHRDELHTPIQE